METKKKCRQVESQHVSASGTGNPSSSGHMLVHARGLVNLTCLFGV